MNATRPIAHITTRLKTKKAKETLSLMLSVKGFTESKAAALEARRNQRTESARWWAQQARYEWRKLAPLLGLPTPDAR